MTAGGVLADADIVTRLEGLLAQALEANEQLTALVQRQRVELAARDAELERVTAELVVLKRMLFGRSSERTRPATADSGGDRSSGGGDGDTDGGGRPAGRGTSSKRGLGARAGRRDYSHLPRVEVVWVRPPLIWYLAVTPPRLRLARTRTSCGSPYDFVNVKSNIDRGPFSGSTSVWSR